MSEFDFEHAYEVCPHCEEEVMLDPELKVQTCPNCGKRIVTCSMCRACDVEGDFPATSYCSHCCLEYQAKCENKEMEEELSHQFSEVRCDYFDDEDNIWCVDAWKTSDDDEGGMVVAKINPDTLEVTYEDPDYAKDELVREVVADKLKEILDELMNPNK